MRRSTMRRKSSWALIVAGMMAAAPVTAQGPPEGRGPCGVPDADARADIVKIMTSPEYAATRVRMQLTGLAADDLVELGGNRRDTLVCARLRATLPSGIRVEGAHAPMAATMYRAGDRYVVAIRATPILEPNPKPRGEDQTISYTLDFEPIWGISGGVSGG
jgi:hypothetical protein